MKRNKSTLLFLNNAAPCTFLAFRGVCWYGGVGVCVGVECVCVGGVCSGVREGVGGCVGGGVGVCVYVCCVWGIMYIISSETNIFPANTTIIHMKYAKLGLHMALWHFTKGGGAFCRFLNFHQIFHMLTLNFSSSPLQVLKAWIIV